MKLQYEVGDMVYHENDYGGVIYKVAAIRKNGVTVTDTLDGETYFFGKRQVLPGHITAIKAEWIPTVTEET